MTGLVIMSPGNPWEGNRFGQHHVAMHLAERVPVLWVDPPISHMTARNDASAARALRHAGLHVVAPNVLRLITVTVPGVSRRLLRDVAQRQMRHAVRRAVGTLEAEVLGTIVATLQHDMLDAVATRRSVFYGTDDYVAGAQLMGADPAWLQRMECRQLAKADAVVAVSPVLQAKWLAQRPDVKLVPNGCVAEHFATADDAPPPADVTLTGPIAGFVGHLSERIDLSMLEAVAESGASLLLVGPRQPTFAIANVEALLARPNVQWVGAKPFAELPSYLRMIDVGLTPYRRSDFNSASFPLKTLEYLAAGRPAVVSDLPAHRWLDSSDVHIVATPRAFAERTRTLLAAPRTAAATAARRAFAARHSWAARTDALAGLLSLPGSAGATLEPVLPESA